MARGEKKPGRLMVLAIVCLLRLLAFTWRVRRRDWDTVAAALEKGPVVFAFFHGDHLPMVALHRRVRLAGMASRSRDGELLAAVIASLGYRIVRGSGSRGAVGAVLAARRELHSHGNSLGLAVDGPRGPALRVQPGAVALSSISGRPVAYTVALCRWAIRLASWDRMMIPLPFARLELRYGLLQPPGGGKDNLEQATIRLGARMLDLYQR